MWYDIIVVAVLAVFTIRGAMKGVIWQLAGIAGIAICFLFADGISQTVGPILAPHLKLHEPLNHWLILFGAYLVLSLISFSVARSLNRWVEKAELKEYNQHLGAIFGFLKGALLVLIATFLIVTVSPDARQSLKSSRTGWTCAHIMYQVHPLLPPKLHDAVADYIHALDDESLLKKYSDQGYIPEGHQHPRSDAPAFGNQPAAPNTGGDAAPVWGGLPSQPSPTPAIPSDPRTYWLQVQQSLGDAAARALYDVTMQSDPQTQSRTQQQLWELVQRSTPEQRSQFAQQLQRSPQQADSVLQSWLSGIAGTAPTLRPEASSNPFDFLGSSSPVTPVVSSPNPAAPAPNPGVPSTTPVSRLTPEQLTARRQELLTKIAGRVTSLPAIRDSIARQIDTMLIQSRVPEPLAVTVLEDWYADVAGEPDPFPATNRDTAATQRILFHLQSAASLPNDRQF